jgi:hypothetical protein
MWNAGKPPPRSPPAEPAAGASEEGDGRAANKTDEDDSGQK